jgi:hypothetical protein
MTDSPISVTIYHNPACGTLINRPIVFGNAPTMMKSALAYAAFAASRCRSFP